MNRFDLSLYLVLDPVLSEPLGVIETARRAVRGGATMVQLRDKTATTEQRIETGLLLKSVLAGSGARLIVNDDVEAAMAIAADGVHIGQGDLDLRAARDRIGDDMLLGLSIGSVAEAEALDPTLVDYVGVGPVFPTATKPDHPPAIGLDGLQAVIRATHLPAVAIGGVKIGHISAILARGAKGVAVVSAICGQPDPEVAARTLRAEISRSLV
ncbi:thiamine phosphate synthase [Rhizobium sp. TRM95796]|uniref:thiamine phosphate synthase n=1 Tax=Rhizobium sp. TRM95796 TaxID=2979862 RepID=UPI0021E6F27B|nr:thiamine phosphate synthase [Rhizobium sp. TRM95796]MCV3768429.1 thiamine phosphate synthase [Rhizobium sp. TRM95796]